MGFGSMQNPGQNQHERQPPAHATQPHHVGPHLVSTSIHRGVHLLVHQMRLYYRLVHYSSARSVGPFGPPKEEKGVQRSNTCFSSSYMTFSRAALNLFAFHNQSSPIDLANSAFQWSWEGVMTRP